MIFVDANILLYAENSSSLLLWLDTYGKPRRIRRLFGLGDAFVRLIGREAVSIFEIYRKFLPPGHWGYHWKY